MERILYAIGYAVGQIISMFFIGIFSLIGYFFRSLKSDPAVFLPLSLRYEHTHIVAGSGHGKTQLLQHLIVTHDLPAVMAGQRSLIVIDSQGDMLEKLLRLSELSPRFGGLSERLMYINPEDIENPPCLNLFDFGLDRLGRYDALEREKLINGAISLYEYLFGALLGAELTARQGVIFRYLARLLMVVPGATIFTLMDFMEDPELVRPYLSLLDGATGRFLTTQLFAPIYATTRAQIITRLWAVLSNSVLAQMFSHRENKLNLFGAMNRGSLILINTAKDLLKPDGCTLFGRFMIAQIAQATQERSAIDEYKRKPTMVYIDEAHDYFEEGAGIELLLNTARKYKVGLTLSHQNLDQFPRKLAATVMSSTAIKFAGGISYDDARALAREMHTTPEFLQQMQKGPGETHFALFMRNYTPEAVEKIIPFGSLEAKARMSAQEYGELLFDNQERYCGPVNQMLLAGGAAQSQVPAGFQLGGPPPV